MFDPEQPFMQTWDTRQTIDQLNGYLTAFAHLNSGFVDHGNASRQCDFGIGEIKVTGDLEGAVDSWLRPIFQKNNRKLRKMEIVVAKSPKKLLYSTLNNWLFRHFQAPDGYDHQEVCDTLCSRIIGIRPWSTVATIKTKPLSASSWTNDSTLIALHDTEKVFSRHLFLLGFFEELVC